MVVAELGHDRLFGAIAALKRQLRREPVGKNIFT
jgi:hypothetical protein